MERPRAGSFADSLGLLLFLAALYFGAWALIGDSDAQAALEHVSAMEDSGWLR